MKVVFFGTLLLFVFPLVLRAEFNYTKCPAVWEVQSETVKQNFTLKKFVPGTYYELAFHDYTQFPVCPIPVCVRSQKVLDYQLNQINDTFSLTCLGLTFPVQLRFNLTEVPGHFLGHWRLLGTITVPDTVVEVKENAEGVYEWVIEFQCLEKFDHVVFTGINLYSRLNNVTDEYVNQLLEFARARGLGVYMDTGLKVNRVDQKNCKYPQ